MDFDNEVLVDATEADTEEIDTSTLSDDQLMAALDGEGIEDTVEAEELEEPEAPAEPEEVSEDKEEEPKEDLDAEKLQKMFEDSQKMIGKQGNELGHMRKRNAELEELIAKFLSKKNEPTDDEPDPEAWENPRKAAREEFTRMQAEEALRKNQSVAQRDRIRETINQIHPDFDDSLLIEAAKDDGVPEEELQNVIDSIWTIETDPEFLERRQQLLIHTQIQRARLIRENKQLKEELANSKEASKGAKKNILSNIKKAAKKSAPSTVGTGSSGITDISAMTPEQISRLSSTQLEELLERNSR